MSIEKPDKLAKHSMKWGHPKACLMRFVAESQLLLDIRDGVCCKNQHKDASLMGEKKVVKSMTQLKRDTKASKGKPRGL